MRPTRSRLRNAITALSLIGFALAAANYWAAADAASTSPATSDFPGWIALLQPRDQVAADVKVTLSVWPRADGMGAHPLVKVVVSACGKGRFDGQLLLAGASGNVEPGSVYPSAVRTDTLRDATLADRNGAEVQLGGARRVRFGDELRQPCLQEAELGQVLVSFDARLDHPTLLRKRSLWFESARQIQSWPKLGAVPVFNLQSLGEFHGTGDVEGAWIRPRSLTVDLSVGKLGALDLVDSSSPPLSASDDADWQQATPFRAKLSLVDQGTVATLQNWLSVSGIFLGVFGSVVATLLLEAGRNSRFSEGRAAARPEHSAEEAVPLSRSMRWSFVPLAALVFIVLRGVRRNRRGQPRR